MAIRRRVSKTELDEFARQAGDNIATLLTDFGDWSAIAWVDGKAYLLETEALNPEGPGYITQVTEEQSKEMIHTDYRTFIF